MSGGYSVITVPSREPTNQTKRDKDKQRFEPTSARAGERIKRRHAERGHREGKARKRASVVREKERGREMRKEGPERGGWGQRRRSRPSLSMTCDRFLLCNSLQLAATRQPLLFPLLPPPAPPPPCCSSQTFPLPLFLLIFVARCCIHHVHRYAIVYNVLDTFCRRSIDSIDSIGGPEKGPPRGPDKDDATADSSNRKAKRILRECPVCCAHFAPFIT